MLDNVAKLLQSEAVDFFLNAADRLEPKVARAIRAALESIRNRATIDRLAKLISQGDIQGVEAVFASQFTDEEWAAYRLAIRDAVRAGEVATAQAQPTITGPGGDFSIVVGDVNPRLAQFAETMTSTRIREIDLSTRDTVRGVIRDGSVAGDGPYAIARRVRSSVGLTLQQEKSVANYEAQLRRGSRGALDRELRDRRSDRSIRRQIDAGDDLSEKQIASLVERYRKRWIKYRSDVIGRTETIRAVQGAQHELFQQMIERGQIDERQVRRTWITTGDDRVRNSHQFIPSMNPAGVGQNEPFASPLGPIMYPGDPDAPASNTIQCRCAVYARIVDRGLLGL